jgi:hypothetical protein
MIHDLLMGTAALFSGITTVVVITLAFKWGRWTGTVDTRLEHIEETLKGGA